MKSDLKKLFEKKQTARKSFAEKPVAEKIRLLESLSERALATRRDTSSALPDSPWNIPEDWRWARMGDVATVVGGSTPRTDHPEYFGGEIPWITPADLSRYTQKTISKGSRNITIAGLNNSGARLLPAGTVLFSSRAPVGYVAIAANPVATNQGFKSFVLNNDVDPDFAYYYLLRARELALALASGTTFLEISGKNAAKLPIPIPSLLTQRQIVAEIEKQFTRLDSGVAALKRIQANLKRYRAAVLKAACEGKLVPTEAELARKESRTYETGEQLLQRILADRRRLWNGRGNYQEPSPLASKSLISLPEGWTWVSLDQLLSKIRNGISVKPDANDGLAILRISAVRPLSVDLEQIRFLNAQIQDYTDYILDEGDLLFTRYNGNPEFVGVAGVVSGLSSPLVYPDKLIRCKLASTDILSDFIAIMANVGISRKYLAKRVRTTAGQARISGGDLKGMPIPLPSLAEQKRIVAEVERRLSMVEQIEATVSASLQHATRLRQSILQQAFEGKLTA